jgi:hypothetical protein
MAISVRVAWRTIKGWMGRLGNDEYMVRRSINMRVFYTLSGHRLRLIIVYIVYEMENDGPSERACFVPTIIDVRNVKERLVQRHNRLITTGYSLHPHLPRTRTK